MPRRPITFRGHRTATGCLAIAIGCSGFGILAGCQKRAHTVAPQNTAITDTLGWIMVQKGDATNGIKFLQQAAGASPNSPDIQYHYAAALDATGKKADATDLLKKTLASGKDFDGKKDAQALLDKLSKG